MTELIEFNRNYVHDGLDEMLLKINDTISPILVIKHIKRPKVHKKVEVLAYYPNQFLSEAGGILGIFLGISVWSIYERVLRPIFMKINTIFV